MWHIAERDGRTVAGDDRSWWFLPATSCFKGSDLRHDAARIRLTGHGADG